ncbi:MAG: AmmeMemoRadiSam system protein B [Candidatus Gastranaerophilaceae bacterium]|jgi:AmmeMemoRadiSam system protein B
MNNLKLVALTPHPPIMVPEVGGNEVKKVQNSINAMNLIGKKIAEINPDTIVLVTPHSRYHPEKFSVYTNELLYGDLTMFRTPSVKLEFKNDLDFVKKLSESCSLNEIKNLSLDHGTIVPMYFIQKTDFKGNLVVLNYCALDKNEHIKFGKKLKEVMESYEQEKKFVFIASGDMSHRLLPEAPAGFHPNAYMFDEKIKDAIEHGDYDFIKNVPFDLRECAGECAYNSIMVAMGVLDSKPLENNVYSYESPWGVGYLVATL